MSNELFGKQFDSFADKTEFNEYFDKNVSPVLSKELLDAAIIRTKSHFLQNSREYTKYSYS